MNFSCYIVDDEPHAIELLRGYVLQTPGLSLAGEGTRPLEALQAISEGLPDILLLDIDMPALNGIELAKAIPPGPALVFITSFREFGADAFDVNASDYLLKPVSYERFLRALQRIRQQLPKRPGPSTLLVKNGSKGHFESVKTSDIIYISGAANYIELHTVHGKIMTYHGIGKILEKLPANGFSRIHKSYIVSQAFIRSIDYGQVTLEGQTILPIGRAYRETFHRQLKNNVLGEQMDNPC
jgi:DNA-binding LytR/AlgR family response regulator